MIYELVVEVLVIVSFTILICEFLLVGLRNYLCFVLLISVLCIKMASELQSESNHSSFGRDHQFSTRLCLADLLKPVLPSLEFGCAPFRRIMD